VAIASFAEAANYRVVAEYYDPGVSGADPVTERPGFMAMLKDIASNGVRTILVESPDRFARDLAVQLAGHDMLKGQGITLIPASAPDFFTEETPTAVMVRQILGAVAQFEKASLVAKLKGARDRKRVRVGKCEGRRSHSETSPDLVAEVRRLRRRNPKTGKRMSLRSIAAVLAARGLLNGSGRPFGSESIRSMLGAKGRPCLHKCAARKAAYRSPCPASSEKFVSPGRLMEAEVPVSAFEVAVERHQIPSYQPSHRMPPMPSSSCDILPQPRAPSRRGDVS
jgi:DNA invertase Pin-like site-specific DNA recombinase